MGSQSYNMETIARDDVDEVSSEGEMDDQKIDFVLVYEKTGEEETKDGKDEGTAAKMRAEYIKLLRSIGLEIKIKDFESENLRKYTAIKIHGSDAIMDIWAQKFLLMKPVEPPNGLVVNKKEVVGEGPTNSIGKLIAMYDEKHYELENDVEKRGPSGSARQLESGQTGKETDNDINDGESEAFKQLLYTTKGYRSQWRTKIENWIFNLLNRNNEKLKLTRDDLFARALRAPFDLSKKKKFLGHCEPEFYNRSERSLMVYRILENPVLRPNRKKGHTLTLSELNREGCFKAVYPIHSGDFELEDGKDWNKIDVNDKIDLNPRQLLHYLWSSLNMIGKFQPLNIIRNYFGSVTAMYFAFVGFYNKALVVPALAGFAVFIYGLLQMSWTDTSQHICESGEKYMMCTDCYLDGTCNATYLSDYCFTTTLTSIANNNAVIVFSGIMMAWLAVFVSLWKRQQSTLAHTWGTTNSRSAPAEVRASYRQAKTKEMRYNEVTDKREKHITLLQRLPWYIFNSSAVGLFVAVAVLTTMTITIYNYTLSITIQKAMDFSPYTRKYSTEIASFVTGGISAIIILGLSYVYRWIANKLTDWENHRTKRDHNNHLIFKIYLFEFFNNYSTLFYIAFIKGNITSPENPRYLFGTYLKIESCAPGGCMSEVSMQMILIMSAKQLIPFLLYLFKTWILKGIQWIADILFCCNYKRCGKSPWHNISDGEGKPQFARDFDLREPAEMYEEYVNNFIQLGFLTMFGTAFPIAPICCLIINVFVLRLDATRYVKRVRRPIGFRCEGIGTWMNILEVLSRIAVLVNAVLIAFTFDWLPHWLYQCHFKSGKTTLSYVDFMLASHEFEHQNTDGSKVNQTCRYWSYVQPTKTDQSSFWLELMMWRMVFIFLFQNVVWVVVNAVELFCDSTPKIVKERMVLEEKIAEEWLNEDDESTKTEIENN